MIGFAIIAGGEGSRLCREGVCVPKPLVSLGGETLLARLIRLFAQNGASSVAVLVRSEADAVAAEAERTATKAGLVPTIVRADTPSSMHSLAALVPALTDEAFCLTTVDTVFSEQAFTGFVNRFRSVVENHTADGLMGVTSLIDDEKPLYVATTSEQHISAFLDYPNKHTYQVSAGVYGLTYKTRQILNTCVASGEMRLRNFQRALLKSGMLLRAYDMGQVIDIDHKTDIEKALSLLQQRTSRESPNEKHYDPGKSPSHLSLPLSSA